MIAARVMTEVIRMDSIIRNSLLAALLGFACATTSAEPKVTYVGLGRYSCSGTSAECAQINFNNSQVEETNRHRYQDEQDRAQRIVDETRRKEREHERDRQRE